MERLYVPYSGAQPSTFSINGHKLVLLAHEPEMLEEFIEQYGGDSVHVVSEEGFESEDKLLAELQAALGARIVLTPEGAELNDVLEILRETLPWIQ